jgi:hypothetical protein
MLLTVNSALAAVAEVHEEAKLKKRFRELQGQIWDTVSSASWEEPKTEAFWKGIPAQARAAFVGAAEHDPARRSVAAQVARDAVAHRH